MLTLIAVAISSRKVRGGVGVHLGLGILIAFTYILFMQISTTFATNSNLTPMLGVWIPNIIFSIIIGSLFGLSCSIIREYFDNTNEYVNYLTDDYVHPSNLHKLITDITEIPDALFVGFILNNCK